MRIIRALRAALILVALGCCSGAWAFTEIAVRPSKDGAGPSHIFHLHDGVVAIVDPLEEKIEAYQDGSSSKIRVAALPNGTKPWRLVRMADKVAIVSEDGTSRIEVPRDEQTWPQEFAAIPNDRADPRFRPARVQRTPSGLMLLAAGGEPALNVHAIGPNYLASLRELERIGDGRRYVLWKEYQLSQPPPQDPEGPKIQVDVYVGRFERDGGISGLVRLDREAMSRIGFDYVTILPDGTVALLASINGGAFTIYSGAFAAPSPLIAELQKVTGRQHRWALPPPMTNFQALIVPNNTHTVTVAENTPQPLSPTLVEKLNAPPTLAEMKKTADAYRDRTWTLVDENHRNPCDGAIVPSIAMSCVRPTRFVWPSREAKMPYPNPMKGVPYDWGGADSIDEFDTKLARGYAAGNIGDTFWADGATRVTAGVDCSGFLSRVWKLGQHVPTANLDTVTTPVADVNFMREGDAFLHSGIHVMLYRGQVMIDGGSVAIRVTEASSRCGAVCDSVYEIDQFQDFTLRRRKTIAN
jgi:hypothetical protein